jgi:hypothetical protein
LAKKHHAAPVTKYTVSELLLIWRHNLIRRTRRYSDQTTVWTTEGSGSIPCTGKRSFSSKSPDRPWGPISFIFYRYRLLFRWG